MKIGIPNENFSGETRVALIPETVKRLVAKGIEVAVEKDAGAEAEFTDKQFEEAGAVIESSREKLLAGSDLVLMIQRPEEKDIAAMREGAALISFLQPYSSPRLFKLAYRTRISPERRGLP